MPLPPSHQESSPRNVPSHTQEIHTDAGGPAFGFIRKGDVEGGGRSVKHGVGAVVGFLAGLLPGQSEQNMGATPSADLDQDAYSGRPHTPPPNAHEVGQSSNSSSLRSKKFTIAPNPPPTPGDLGPSSGSSGDPHQDHTTCGGTNPGLDQRSLRSQVRERRGGTVTRERSSFAPPQIRTRLPSPGAVAMVNVMCQSAPGLGSTLTVPGAFRDGLVDVSQLDNAPRDKGKATQKPLGRMPPKVPSLLVTGIEGDDWGEAGSEGDKTPLHGKQEPAHDEDDEEEGELDFTRMNFRKMLLRHKRYQSTRRSLRQHLGDEL